MSNLFEAAGEWEVVDDQDNNLTKKIPLTADGLRLVSDLIAQAEDYKHIGEAALVRTSKYAKEVNDLRGAIHDIINSCMNIFVVHDSKDSTKPIEMKPQYIERCTLGVRAALKKVGYT